ncbi:META domain-containing protein [Salinivibrio proteolyticus]|uniref:META domain-containing protein n=1 Tax=Salinivibrio proteolyticus TaxID=334715 RepID=A0ABY7LC68_9GAMM|nr:META domain-containing protein [Salinivibrio proteolyticus]WBA13929.1 META domain-containing protein [Salinivibrio proteolyticus]
MMTKLLLPALVAMMITGCVSQPTSDVVDTLISKTWVVEYLNNQGIIDNSRITLDFNNEGRVAGMASCNRYFAGYSIDNRAIKVEQAASTMMACSDALMTQENHFLDTLQSVHSFDIDGTGALILSGDNIRILAR